VTPITASCFGPSGSTTNVSSADFAQNSVTAVGVYASAYCGPSFIYYLGGNNGDNGNYEYIYYFQLYPTVNSYFFPSLPTYSYVGIPSYSTTTSTNGVTSSNALGVINNTGINNPQTWTLLYQQNVASCVTDTAQNYSGNMGFPFCSYRTPYLNFLYYQVIFAVPYWGANALNACIYASASNSNENVVYQNIPGYILAFYNRSYPASQDAPYQPVASGTCGLVTNPYSSYTTTEYEAYGNYYPVIYEATCLVNQTNGTLTYNQTLLGFLNNTFGTTSTSLQDFLVSQGWLENVTGSGTGSNTNSNGSSTSTGVNLGAVFNYDVTSTVELGDGWWFAGFVPYNLDFCGSSPTNWTTTSTTFPGPTGDDILFSEGNVVMASVVPLDASGFPIAYYPASVGSSACTSGCDVSGCEAGCATGNYFWDSITTNWSDFSGQSFTIYIAMENGYMQANGASNSSGVPPTNPQYSVSYISGSCLPSSAVGNLGYSYFYIFYYSNPYYNSITVDVNYISGGNSSNTFNYIFVWNYSSIDLAFLLYSNGVFNFSTTVPAESTGYVAAVSLANGTSWEQ
jgi:hypothetical protein